MSNQSSQPVPVSEWRLPLSPEGRDTHLAMVRNLAWLLDNAVVIPGTRFRIGLDVLLGLIPGFGDVIGMLIGAYILQVGVRAGVSRVVLIRMLTNIGIDAAVGAVPFVGDVFDAAWRANAKNARLLEQAVAEPQQTHRASLWTLVGLILGVVLITFAGLALTVWLAVLLVRWLG